MGQHMNIIGVLALVGALSGMGGASTLKDLLTPGDAARDSSSDLKMVITQIGQKINEARAPKEEERKIFYLPAGDAETARNYYKDTSLTSPTPREPYYKSLPTQEQEGGE